MVAHDPPTRVHRNRLTQAISSCGVALCVGIGIAIALDPKSPPYLGGLIALLGGYLSWLIGWQSSVRLRPDGILLDNMFISNFVPWCKFREFRVRNGLKIVMTDGRVLSSFSFGGSLAGELSGYRRMKKLVGAFEEERRTLVAEQPTTDAAGRHQDCGVRKQVRVQLVPILLLFLPLELLGIILAMLR